MLQVYEIPVDAQAQTFSVDLLGVSYKLLLVWNAVSSSWVIDISDSNNLPIVQGVPMVTGVNLLAQYGHLGFGGGMLAMSDVDPSIVPGYADLGNTGHLYFIVSS